MKTWPPAIAVFVTLGAFSVLSQTSGEGEPGKIVATAFVLVDKNGKPVAELTCDAAGVTTAYPPITYARPPAAAGEEKGNRGDFLDFCIPNRLS